MQCPECNARLNRFDLDCTVCGWELPEAEQEKWVPIGLISSQVFAEMAREALNQMDIPVAMLSRSGIFGSMGLTLNPWFGKGTGCYELSVPVKFAAEATNMLDMTLGDKYQKVDPE